MTASSATYDVSSVPTSGTYPHAWWCRGCGKFRAVDDDEHCRACVPPLSTALAIAHMEHAVADEILRRRGVPRCDPEREYHRVAVRAARRRWFRLVRAGR